MKTYLSLVRLCKVGEAIAKNGEPSLVFIVLPNNRADVYSVIKKKLTKDYGIPSQCCLSKNLVKGMSVATKIAVQMSCKVGGVPWIIHNNWKESLCVIGFDVYHSAGMAGTSFGAIVATMDKNLSKCCSFVERHKHREEVTSKVGNQVSRCLEQYYKLNGSLPQNLVFYRDGVGEGQIDFTFESEVEAVKEAIAKAAVGNPEKPKLTYIIVSKRINTRFMTEEGNKRFGNPSPGTVVDDVVTLHYRYDFFLVSQIARQGTVSPTSYNVIYDEIGKSPDDIQQLTFKLCHNYYNWTGTISVPSVCQNAHKLAYITGESIKQPCHENLRNLPFYL